MEVLPRLLLLVPHLEADPSLQVLVCNDRSATKWATKWLEMVVGPSGKSYLSRFYPYVQLYVLV
jgi:hypothetical protein